MTRFVALFLLVVGVSGLQNKALEQFNALKEKASVESIEQAKQSLDKYLESFQKKDLKDSTVYQEYLAVRDGAKRATAMLENARKANPPTPSVNKAKVEHMKADKIEAAELKTKMEAKQEDELAEDVKQVEQKEQKKLKLKHKKLHLKKSEELEEVKAEHRKLSSPYRAASKKPEHSSMIETQSEQSLTPVAEMTPEKKAKIDVVHKKLDELRKQGVFDPNSRLQTRHKREVQLRDAELADERLRHEHAKVMAAHAHQLCEDRKMCHYRVDQKLLGGYYDKFLANTLNHRHNMGLTPHHVGPEQTWNHDWQRHHGDGHVHYRVEVKRP